MSGRALIGWFSFFGLALLVGCFKPPVDPNGDCRRAGTCECAFQSDCQEGLDCIDGRCQVAPDGGGNLDLGAPCKTGSECSSGKCLPPGPGRDGVCTVACDAQT